MIETNSGGQYGWWGTQFQWSPDGTRIAYSRADSIGFVNFDKYRLDSYIEITPYQTLSDWAWIPPIAWGPNSEILYYIVHGDPIAFEKPEASQVFNLMALSPESSTIGPLVERSGMFSQIAVSPNENPLVGESSSSVAYLQAIEPLESETSDYRLVLLDQDGSNKRTVFPPEWEPGMEPGSILWAPDASRIAFIYQNNLWILDPQNVITQPVTAEGQTSAFDWSP
jgi:hypothetical protein